MDTITLSITLIYSSLGGLGEEDCRSRTIYFDNFNNFICLSHTEKVDPNGNVQVAEEVFRWGDFLEEYDDKDSTWKEVKLLLTEYTVSKLDALNEPTVTWKTEYAQEDMEGVVTFYKESKYLQSGNPMALDCPVHLIVTDIFTLKLLPDISKYNLAALRAIGAVITWDLGDSKIPVFYTGHTYKSEGLTSEERYHFERNNMTSSGVTLSDVKIPALLQQFAGK
ncbi:hypothetical protein QWY85_11825 [Neolewinella lacunae]|uniref:Uncharacterized protein n=1 Tax=Neolewinella lacunae TaxID=1517758 RepID=A0A923TCZ4_9BACT|nr:hypothetical protein [Neolewinella lacunae]MBC6994272.1 hypothetical protein [Neolewinella lacunae]MDN3635350.1 hypothetical protein [Neolewinella lacunae]